MVSKAKHNDVFVMIRSFYGIRERTAYILKCRLEGCGWEQFVTDYGDYVCGYQKPHYPVPATIADTMIDRDTVIIWDCYDDIAWQYP